MKEKIKKGFTLVETIIVIAIISFFALLTIFSYGTFNSSFSVSSVAKEMSLVLRQAQTYALSAKETSVGSNKFSSSYGIYFDMQNTLNYFIFTDKNNDGRYDGGSSCLGVGDCLVETEIIQNSVSISSFCGVNSSGLSQCPIPNAKKVGIVFIRPSQNTYIYVFDQYNNLISYNNRSIQVNLISKQGKQASVTIKNSGQIGVQ